MSVKALAKTLVTAVVQCITDDDVTKLLPIEFTKDISDAMEKSIPGFALATAVTKSVAKAVAPELMGSFIEEIEYSKLREVLLTSDPNKLNHDLQNLLKKSALTSIGYIERLYVDKLNAEMGQKSFKHIFIKREQVVEVQDLFKKLKDELAKLIQTTTVHDHVLEDPTDCLENLTKNIFVAISLDETSELAAFFTQNLPFCFDLACKEALKDKANDKEFKAFQIWILENINQKITEGNAKILAEIQDLKAQKDTKSSEELKSYLETECEALNSRFDAMLVIVQEISVDVKEIKREITQIGKDIIELKGLQNKQLNLNDFPDYRSFLTDIEDLNVAFEEKQTEKQETLELLHDETDERKRKRFEKDLTTIDQELLEIDGKRTHKSDELSHFKTYIEKTWLSLYSENAPISPRLLHARELFEKGDLAAANAALDPQALQHDYDLVNKATEIIKQKQASLAQEFLAKANFTVLEKANEHWFMETKQYYTQALALHESYETCFVYAYFLQTHNQVLEAATIYEKALFYVCDNYEKATTLNNLAVLQRAKNEFEKAESSYLEALEIYRELARVNPQTYLPYVATTLNNLGNLQSDKNEFEKAESSYLEALAIRHELAQQNPAAYQISLAETLVNFAIFYLYSVPDKDKSLGLSLNGFMNAFPYHQQVPKALQLCQTAIQIWQAWGEDLLKYLQENKGE